MKKFLIFLICSIMIIINCGCENNNNLDSNSGSSVNQDLDIKKPADDTKNNEKIVSLCDTVSEITNNFNEQKITKDEVINSMVQLKDTCTDNSNVCSALKSFGTIITTNTAESRVKVFVDEVQYQCTKTLE